MNKTTIPKNCHLTIDLEELSNQLTPDDLVLLLSKVATPSNLSWMIPETFKLVGERINANCSSWAKETGKLLLEEN